MVPLAHGNDGGGSLRIPAACCGLVGLKAQRHRVTTAPDLGASQLVVDGVLTRTVADTAALLDVLSGYESGDSAWAAPPAEPFSASAARAPGNLRIAFTTVPPLPDATVEDRCARAVRDAAALCESLGHAVEEVCPPWQSDDIDELFGAYFGAHVALSVQFAAALASETGIPAAGQMEALSYELWSRATRLSSIEFQVLQTQLQGRMRALIGFLERFDALITPALAERPPALGTLDGTAPDPGATFDRAGYFTPFTPIFNASGQPAITIPLYHGDDGLPLAIQIAGRPAGEPTLLALATQLETAEPWAARRPQLGSVRG